MFKALGWDVDHERETNPYEQEVKVELGVEVARSQKRADYAFCENRFGARAEHRGAHCESCRPHQDNCYVGNVR
jgi:hypothetical protein